ncbi:hypothetical protein PHAMO_210069 [Magnetospirillum molischianum DSM 120]|uniref:Uncharacterized protein n=1 Tax=Magnetospirillum molischianum DSM 120 TaxID=1150626 RepID=H8FQC0_MAGML|nr:hypothetical protein PHAMO_210069 [Magnetospirillum molischianum DSM 120]
MFFLVSLRSHYFVSNGKVQRYFVYKRRFSFVGVYRAGLMMKPDGGAERRDRRRQGAVRLAPTQPKRRVF